MDWYYLRDGKTMGPVSEGSIRAWLESGFLHPDDLLWRDGMKQWAPAAELAEFGGPGEAEFPETTEVEQGADGPAGAGPAADSRTSGRPMSAAEPLVTGPAEGTAPSRADARPWGPAGAGWSEAPATYAGIWARAGASAIDLMLLVTIVLLLFRPELPTSGNIEEMSKLNPAITPVFVALAWLYFGLLEGSALQASLGKLAFGLKVTDLGGNRLPPGRAFVRALLKVVLMEITAFLSFLPAAFTARRQALHDIVAGTIVLVR
jgi:uncharacterized RDD family membrane protein YckC